MINFEIIKKVINDWDPINLLSCCPNDEYDIEINEICKKLKDKDYTIENLGNVIYDIFVEYFGETFNFNKDECKSIASIIINYN